MIVLTGATGLLGSHLAYDLVAGGEEIIALKRPTSSMMGIEEVFSFYSDDPASLLKKISWKDCDLMNFASVHEALEDASHIVHAAALVSFDPADRKKMIRNNVDSTANLVSAALDRKVKRFVHISSTAAIGRPPAGEEANESMIWRGGKGTSGYAESKFKSEMEVWRGIEEGLSAVILNPSIILGPGFWGGGSGAMLSRIAQGMRFYTQGVTGYVGVWDVVNAIRKSLLGIETENGQVQNPGTAGAIAGSRYIISSENLSYREIFTLMADALGVKAPSIKASHLMTGLAWRSNSLGSLLPGIRRILTRETADASHSIIRFSNARARDILKMDFEPVSEVVTRIVSYYDKSGRNT